MTRPLIILCCLLCVAAMPPVPRTKLQSPKGAEFARSLAKVPSAQIVVSFIRNGSLVWSNSNAYVTIFTIESKPSLKSKWTFLAKTNGTSINITMTNASGFYRVSASR